MPRSSSRRAARKPFTLHQPNGQLTGRVQAVGPEHFGLLCFDCAKDSSRYCLADFYSRVLLPPTTLPHTRGHFRAAIDDVRRLMAEHRLADLVVAIEQTGDYHRPVQRAFRDAGFDTRLVHPHTAKHYREPADPEHKTDDADLGGIFRAATHGFGLCEPVWPEHYVTLQIFHRHRRDLVDKNTRVKLQILERLHAAMPGYAACFSHFWESPVALPLARHTTSAQAVLAAGADGIADIMRKESIRIRQQTIAKVLAWAQQAPPGHSHSLDLRLVLCSLDDDRLAKSRQIQQLERSLAGLIAATPYVLLLAIPGINVVSVADLAGELGPIEFYAHPGCITGRAGLVPGRYQSGPVDRPDGPLRRRGHRRLRAALLQAADNLVQGNHYFRARSERWQQAGKDPRWIRVKVAKQFSRLAYALVAGRQLFAHPCTQQQHYVLRKLLEFHGDHGTPPAQLRADLEAAAEQLPSSAHAAEAVPPEQRLAEVAQKRGPQPLSEILPIVLARLGKPVVESPGEGTDLS